MANTIPTDDGDELVRRALERLRNGDPAAKNDLLSLALRQIERMSRKHLHTGTSYEGVRRWEQTDDVVQGVLERVSRALDRHDITSPKDFFRLAANHVHWELKTLRNHYLVEKSIASHHATDTPQAARNEPGVGRSHVADAAAPPETFAELSELLDSVENLTPGDREMIELVLFLGLTQEQAADHLEVSLSTFKRRYTEARLRLEQGMPKRGAR
ncbi:MAG: RNA polymerase sigma factor [Planctomycetaceae bacterium]